jgi:hypothetical protein
VSAGFSVPYSRYHRCQPHLFSVHLIFGVNLVFSVNLTFSVNSTYGDACSDACLPERSLACVPGRPPVRSATASDARLPPRVLALRRKTLCRRTVFQNDLSSEQRLSGTASFFCSGHASAWDVQAIGLQLRGASRHVLEEHVLEEHVLADTARW